MSLSSRSSRGRAILGVIVLYGLLLQAFLVAAAPARASTDALAVLCAHDGSGAPAGEHGAADHDHACCTAAHLGTWAPPSPPVSLLAWVPPATVAAEWRPEAAIPKTGPPTRQHSARGPPPA